MHDNQQVQEYWNRDDVESMYDKHLLKAEIELIKRRILPNAKILDVGRREGKRTLAYSAIPGMVVHAVDFSKTRLDKAMKALRGEGQCQQRGDCFCVGRRLRHMISG